MNAAKSVRQPVRQTPHHEQRNLLRDACHFNRWDIWRRVTKREKPPPRHPEKTAITRPTTKGCATARFWVSPVFLFTGGILPHFRPNYSIFFRATLHRSGIVSLTGMSHPRESRETVDRKQIRHGEGIPRFGVARGYLAGVELSGRGFNPRPAIPDRQPPTGMSHPREGWWWRR